MKVKTLHLCSLVVGWFFLVFSFVLAVFFSYPHFYTAFAFGSWLVLDWLDWKLNGTSILAYFFNHRHRDAFVAFFALASIFCFLVDYVYGVKIAGMWTWVAYEPIHFVRMYLFMNASYTLSMYELFRVIRSRLSSRVSTRHLLRWRVSPEFIFHTYEIMSVLGVLLLLVPLYAWALHTHRLIEYAMLFPFLGMLFLADGLNGLLHGRPVLAELVRFNRLQVASLVVTVAAAAGVTEVLNLFGGEWRYLRMPFPHIQIFGIPAAVFLGWIPLVLGAIATVNLIRQADTVWDRRHNSTR